MYIVPAGQGEREPTETHSAGNHPQQSRRRLPQAHLHVAVQLQVQSEVKIRLHQLSRQEIFNQTSINLLKNSGIDFDKLAVNGIEHQTFAEHFITSGLIMNKDVHWYGFHTDHDFAYLLRIFTNQLLPANEMLFMQELGYIFPNLYDIKMIADNSFGIFRGGLTTLSDKLGVYRDDDCEHQAGSDSKITAKCFFELKKFSESCVEACKGEIYGINRTDISTASSLMSVNNGSNGIKAMLHHQDNSSKLQIKKPLLGQSDTFLILAGQQTEQEFGDPQLVDFDEEFEDENHHGPGSF